MLEISIIIITTSSPFTHLFNEIEDYALQKDFGFIAPETSSKSKLHLFSRQHVDCFIWCRSFAMLLQYEVVQATGTCSIVYLDPAELVDKVQQAMRTLELEGNETTTTIKGGRTDVVRLADKKDWI